MRFGANLLSYNHQAGREKPTYYSPALRVEGKTKSPNTTEKMDEQIKDIILSYCEGINHLEFSLEDLDEMVEKIAAVSSDKIKELEEQIEFDNGKLGGFC